MITILSILYSIHIFSGDPGWITIPLVVLFGLTGLAADVCIVDALLHR